MMYHQITFEERYTLGLLRQQGLTRAAIARVLGRHRSTIGREVRRSHRTHPRSACRKAAAACWSANRSAVCSALWHKQRDQWSGSRLLHHYDVS
ncbi:MAG: helix-turn-helix domain-containing protein [Gemmatimonadales bacterium]|nr:helix-turn-helix domain-containing protein [Gemmatimonadales bacterium]NIN10031.1 helix-turn-helix domain-containing protein [Gemmatimonadales bacterium]NIQ98683.1 helix-turn-helix domain-containing protein [Gemmatimonadales bacterium]NIS63560.1 helix-turn-helix domain-containing protein [Gemmatimonadales bacterium]